MVPPRAGIRRVKGISTEISAAGLLQGGREGGRERGLGQNGRELGDVGRCESRFEGLAEVGRYGDDREGGGGLGWKRREGGREGGRGLPLTLLLLAAPRLD